MDTGNSVTTLKPGDWVIPADAGLGEFLTFLERNWSKTCVSLLFSPSLTTNCHSQIITKRRSQSWGNHFVAEPSVKYGGCLETGVYNLVCCTNPILSMIYLSSVLDNILGSLLRAENFQIVINCSTTGIMSFFFLIPYKRNLANRSSIWWENSAENPPRYSIDLCCHTGC